MHKITVVLRTATRFYRIFSFVYPTFIGGQTRLTKIPGIVSVALFILKSVSTVRTRKNLCVYLEDAPVGDSCFATGLSKALVPLLREVAARTSSSFILQAHQNVNDADILRFGSATIVASKFHHYVARAASKLPFWLGNVVARLHGTHLGREQHNFAGASESMVCWSAIGVDPLSVTRACAFAVASGLDFEAYLVDDIETHPSNQGKLGLHSAVRRGLRTAAAVYAITPELASRCAELYGIPVTCLPLTAEIPPPPQGHNVCPTYFAAYLGSINHLYEDGLKLLFQMVAELRSSIGLELRVRMVSRPADVARLFDGAVPDWVVSGAEDSLMGVAAALSDSQFCYLPYSRRDSAHAMVRSSFPSKLLDYLSWARHIVVFAPNDSVPFNLFNRERLAGATCSPSELRDRLGALVGKTDSESAQYRDVLIRHHGPGQASSIIFGKA